MRGSLADSTCSEAIRLLRAALQCASMPSDILLQRNGIALHCCMYNVSSLYNIHMKLN